MHPVDGPSGEAEHGRQQGERRGHHEKHGGDRPDRQPLEEWELKDEQSEQRDDDRGAGEKHGPTRGGKRGRHRRTGLAAFEQPLPVAGDDEQGVVDSHPQPDHGQHLGSEDRDVQEVAEQVLEGEADGDAEKRGQDWQAHGHHRAEGDEHDQHGTEDPGAFARRPGRR